MTTSTLRGAALGCATLLALTGGVAAAQHVHEHAPSPYADGSASGIAGLSSGELEQLTNGEGMGLARPAELNHDPGPKHVLELAAALGLSAEQQAAVERIHAAMLDEARRVGAAIVERERVLDRRFRHRHVDAATLEELAGEIGRLQGELRFVHLRAHLDTAVLLTSAQITAYDAARGYRPAGGEPG